MANPQAENGHIDIANEIAEALMKVNLSAYESRILWFIFRKTYGWNKKEDWISLSQFSMCTGLDRRLVHRAIKSLSSKKMIVINKDDSNHITYGFQKNWEKWDVSSKKMTVINRDDGLSSKEMTRVSSKEIPTKDTLTKDTLTKDNKDIVEIVSYLNQKTGKNFKAKSKNTASHINARLAEGHTVEDCKRVIDNKCAKWLHDSKMVDYLRPQTLFGTKFESYLNEVPPKTQGVSDKTRQTLEAGKRWLEKHEGQEAISGEHGDDR
jgi:phage replication O-like protein O